MEGRLARGGPFSLRSVRQRLGRPFHRWDSKAGLNSILAGDSNISQCTRQLVGAKRCSGRLADLLSSLFDPSRDFHHACQLLLIIGFSPVFMDGGQQLDDVEHIDIPQCACVGAHRSPHNDAA